MKQDRPIASASGTEHCNSMVAATPAVVYLRTLEISRPGAVFDGTFAFS